MEDESAGEDHGRVSQQLPTILGPKTHKYQHRYEYTPTTLHPQRSAGLHRLHPVWGVGAFVGTLLAGKVLAAHAHALATPVNGLSHDWAAIWRIPALGAVGVLIIFLILFRESRKTDVA